MSHAIHTGPQTRWLTIEYLIINQFAANDSPSCMFAPQNFAFFPPPPEYSKSNSYRIAEKRTQMSHAIHTGPQTRWLTIEYLIINQFAANNSRVVQAKHAPSRCEPTCHCPPRGALIPRAFSASAICRSEVPRYVEFAAPFIASLVEIGLIVRAIVIELRSVWLDSVACR